MQDNDTDIGSTSRNPKDTDVRCFQKENNFNAISRHDMETVWNNSGIIAFPVIELLVLSFWFIADLSKIYI